MVKLKQVKQTHIIGVIFTTGMGVLLHFLYEWSGRNRIAALFSAVNESVWEHLKLLAIPFVLFGIYEYYAYGREKVNFLPAKFYAMLMGFCTIIVLYYVYTGILGYGIDAINILIFPISVSVSYYFSARWLKHGVFSRKDQSTTAVMFLISLMLCFWVFTTMPPKIGLFMDPRTGQYGI